MNEVDRVELAERLALMIALKRGALAAKGRGWLRAEAAIQSSFVRAADHAAALKVFEARVEFMLGRAA